jgi:hypothetical protein
VRAEICLELRVQRDIAGVIEEQIELDLVVAGSSEQSYALANVTRQAPVPLLSLATLFVVICAILAVGLALKYRKGRLTARL